MRPLPLANVGDPGLLPAPVSEDVEGVVRTVGGVGYSLGVAYEDAIDDCEDRVGRGRVMLGGGAPLVGGECGGDT
jgi:hypothetical protein